MAYVEDKYVEQVIADFDAIKQAIISNGTDVPYGTDTKEYGALINQACTVNGNIYNWLQTHYIDNCLPITLFKGKTDITSVPLFDTSKHESFMDMFNGCTSLKTIPLYDMSSGLSFERTFFNCSSLEEIPQFDFSKMEYCDDMFNGCTSLKIILIVFDFSKLYSAPLNMFEGCTSLEQISFKPDSIMCNSLSIPSPCLTYESIQSIIDGLYDIGYGELHLNSVIVNRLTETQLEQILSKNWYLI